MITMSAIPLRLPAICGGAIVVALLGGCASTVSTYGGESSFKCAAKFDDGVPCDSISGTAANFGAENLSWQRKEKSTKAGATGATNAMAAESPTEIAAKMREFRDQPPVFGEAVPGNISVTTQDKLSPRQMPTLNSGQPLRIPERILRIWVAPYEDDEASLNDQKYIYLTVQRGAWQVEANKIKAQNSYKQIYPLGKPAVPAEEANANLRSSARSQAQGALINNPNLSGTPASAGNATTADEQ